VVEVWDTDVVRMARVDFGGIRKEVCLAYLPDLRVGDYAIVHVGFAISQVDEESALETLRLFEQLGTLSDELGGEATRTGPTPT
jgi:hydrogenase expression/formation protein HypC